MKQKSKLIIATVLLAAIPFFASAASWSNGLVPCGGPTQNPCTVKDIFVLIARTTNFLIAFAGIFAVYYIVGAGFWLIVSMGNEESITTRKKQLSNAVVGLALCMMAFLFIKNMNPVE